VSSFPYHAAFYSSSFLGLKSPNHKKMKKNRYLHFRSRKTDIKPLLYDFLLKVELDLLA
jgi:hypothetical protein